MHEISLINAIRGMFPVSPKQKNALFTCDAEIVEFGDAVYGFSMDEFSAEEDFFPASDPERLGENLAVATIADVLAAGCVPEFFLHSVVEPADCTGFALAFAQGVSLVLKEGGCFLLGGDMGKTSLPGAWRYTGLAIGRLQQGAGRGPAHLSRILPPEPQAIWITGTVGDGNACVLSGGMPLFEPRFIEAVAIREHALACMDTSGGLADSLIMLHMLNPRFRLDIAPETIPYAPEAAAMAAASGFPLTGFAFGGAGEYELLFTTREDQSMPFATRIGTAYPVIHDAADRLPRSATGEIPMALEGSGVYWGTKLLPSSLPDPRLFSDLEAYVQHIAQTVAQCTE